MSLKLRTPPEKVNFAVCGGLLYRQPNTLLLMQFFEHYIWHGVSKIYLYIFEELKPFTNRLLQHYRDRDVFITLI